MHDVPLYRHLQKENVKFWQRRKCVRSVGDFSILRLKFPIEML